MLNLFGDKLNSTINSEHLEPIIQRFLQITYLSRGSNTGPETGNGY